MSEYYTILTTIGQAKIANAIANNETLDLTTLKIGDGGGSVYDPVEGATDLVNEVYSTPVSSLSIDPQNNDWIVAEGVVPVDEGGWWMREVGLYDVDGDLIAIAKYPETYKPTLAQGTANDFLLFMILEVGNAADVVLQVDPGVVLATRDFVLSQGFITQTYFDQNCTIAALLPGGTTGQVLTKQSDTDGDAVWSDPPEQTTEFTGGEVMMWHGGIDGATKQAIGKPGWYLCDGGTYNAVLTPDLRGKFVVGAGGSYNVDDNGGSENLTLAQNNLPNVTLNVSGSTNTTGDHTHGYPTVNNGAASDDAQAGGGGAPVGNPPTTPAGSHSHSVTGTTTSINGGVTQQAIDKRPPYYGLFYIKYCGVAA